LLFRPLQIFPLIFWREADTEVRKKRLERKKMDAGKRKMVQHKVNGAEKQALRCVFEKL